MKLENLTERVIILFYLIVYEEFLQKKIKCKENKYFSRYVKE